MLRYYFEDYFLNKINPFLQLSECEETKNGSTDMTPDNKHCIAIVTNQLQDTHNSMENKNKN